GRTRPDPARARSRSGQYAGKESRVSDEGRRRWNRPGRTRADRSGLARRFGTNSHGVLRRGGAVRQRAAPFDSSTGRVNAMDAILIVNAGSSSVKFQVFQVQGRAG